MFNIDYRAPNSPFVLANIFPSIYYKYNFYYTEE